MKYKALRLDEHGLESLLLRSNKWLHDYVPQRVWYPKELYGWRGPKENAMHLFKEACNSERNSFLESEINNNKNLYSIWSEKIHYSKNWELKYIGQRHSSGIKERLKNHLFGAPFGIGAKPRSKFDEVFKLLQERQMVYVSHIQILPESLRGFIENSLICINSFKGKPLWNSHGTKAAEREIEELIASGIDVRRIIRKV